MATRRRNYTPRAATFALLGVYSFMMGAGLYGLGASVAHLVNQLVTP